MLRYEEEFLPPDPVFPEELAELGFFITKDDQIRVINSPEQGPRHKIDRNERVNEVHMNALHRAIHTIIVDRLIGMCMNPIYLPITEVANKPTVPVFVSSNIGKASRVVVFFGDIVEDLGVFSYRDVCEGISFGSVLNLAKAVLGENPQDSPVALVISNPGNSIWHNASGAALNTEAFRGRARQSAVTCDRPLSLRNCIEGNTCLDEHIRFIFEQLLARNLSVGAKIDIIGLSEGGLAALLYLRKNWNIWGPHVSCIGIVNPEQVVSSDFDLADLEDPKSFFSFFRDRGRAWILSSQPLGTREIGLGTHGCNCFSSGEDSRIACMVSRALPHIMAWLNIMDRAPLMAEEIVVHPGEPAAEHQVITALLRMNLNDPYTEEVGNVRLLEKLEGFVSGMALQSDMFAVFADRATNEEATGDQNESDVEEIGVKEMPGDPDSRDDIVVAPSPPYDLRNLHAIPEESAEE